MDKHNQERSQRKKVIQQAKESPFVSEFFKKVNQHRQFCEDQVTYEVQIACSYTNEPIIEIENSISDLESGCSAVSDNDESPNTNKTVQKKHSPIMSHARQLRQIKMAVKNEQKASRFQINLTKSNVLSKRCIINDRTQSDRLGSALLNKDLIGTERIGSARISTDIIGSTRIMSAQLPNLSNFLSEGQQKVKMQENQLQSYQLLNKQTIFLFK